MQDNGIDIVVTSPTGDRTLVVEAKTGGSVDDATMQLLRYMLAMGADVGLVFAGDVIRILKQTYRESPAVEVVGEFSLSLARGIEPTQDPAEFEDQIQQWLEALRDHREPAAEPFLSALNEYVMPSLADGIVRAAHPRFRHAAG